MSLVEITIDTRRCQVPVECRKCLTVCPQAVFRIKPLRVEKFKETEPQDWGLRVGFRDACVVCMDCVKICPQKALKVKVLA